MAFVPDSARPGGSGLLVAGGEVLTPAGALRRADVLIVDGAITGVGERLDAGAAERLDAAGMLVVPGLINAHTHSGENFNPGLYENLPLDLWFVRSHQVVRRTPLPRDAIYTRTLLGAALMLRSGTTSAVDFLYEAPEITLETLEPVVRAYTDAGMRATILLGIADKPFAASLPLSEAQRAAAREAPPPQPDALLELADSAIRRWHSPGGLIGIGLGPSAPQRCSDGLFEATVDLARSRGVPWQTHVLETRTQALTARRWHEGKSFVEVLAERDLLGPETTLVHTVWLRDRDIELISDAGTPAVHCLLSNLRLGDGVAPLPALRRAGVRVALGTDGRGCDETLDMFELAKMTALLHKARGGDFRRWPTARDALAMCTAEASVCTGHGERLGRIEAGARGDLVLLPRDAPPFTPLHDPVRQLVYGAPSQYVDTVVVDGRIVVRGGRLCSVDMTALLEDARRHAREALAVEGSYDAAALEAAVAQMYAEAERTALDVDAYIGS